MHRWWPYNYFLWSYILNIFVSDKSCAFVSWPILVDFWNFLEYSWLANMLRYDHWFFPFLNKLPTWLTWGRVSKRDEVTALLITTFLLGYRVRFSREARRSLVIWFLFFISFSNFSIWTILFAYDLETNFSNFVLKPKSSFRKSYSILSCNSEIISLLMSSTLKETPNSYFCVTPQNNQLITVAHNYHGNSIKIHC